MTCWTTFLVCAVLFCSGAMTPTVTTAQPPSPVKIDGSSTVFPISEAVAEEYQKSTRGAVRVTVGISGTGGGFKKFCRGETDIQDASRPISSDEMEECRKHGIQEYLAAIRHASGAETDVGTVRSRQSHEVESGQPGVAE